MATLLLKYLTVFFLSSVKFIAGPALGLASGLTVVETSVLTVLGMMATVLVFTFAGEEIKQWYIRKTGFSNKRFSRRNRRFVNIWRKYGTFGVSFLTPVIFSPIAGTLLVCAVGGPRIKIFRYMLFSAVFWAFTLTLALRHVSSWFGF